MLLPAIEDMEECSVYPGAYTLTRETKKILKECRICDMPGDQTFPVNMEELDHEYRIEVPLPGQKRENILIDVRPQVLDISLVHNSINTPVKVEEHITAERHVTLPPETDPSFASARYENGMLVIYLPKGEFTMSGPWKIVVY